MSGIVFDSTKPLRAFDGDVYALDQVCKLITQNDCKDFVETGTFLGGTALGMRQAFPQSLEVWTVEADEALHAQATIRFSGKNIHNFLGNSVDVLKAHILPHLRKRPFFFLDSHVSVYNVSQNPSLVEYYPLKEEILAIAAYKYLNPIIAIHDFFNPEHPDFGYDRDHGAPLDWDYIKREIAEVFPDATP